MHIKTAGTSFLEAFRTIAQVQPDLLRDIYAFSLEWYETDSASYHVSAELHRAPTSADMPDTAVPMLLDLFDARHILHVTFGPVLTAHNPSGRKSQPEAGGTAPDSYQRAPVAIVDLRLLQPCKKRVDFCCVLDLT